MSNSQTGPLGASGSYNWATLTGQNSYGNFTVPTISLGINELQMTPYISINLVKAHGGTIVICRKDSGGPNVLNPEYFIIPESSRNFDKELGKIISLYMLKT